MTIGRALELFGHGRLSDFRDQIDDPFGSVVYRELECPWTEKGRAMRGLAERFGGDADVILTDGIKLDLEEGWALMLPDPDTPRFYVYAEADDIEGLEGSQNLADNYADIVAALIDG
jgi:mannose-1-phosphate guanylyltransferase/phosphomannomutase